jgi:hypothetical protein
MQVRLNSSRLVKQVDSSFLIVLDQLEWLARSRWWEAHIPTDVASSQKPAKILCSKLWLLWIFNVHSWI